MKRLLFVYNPVSGTGVIKKKMFEVVDFYSENGYLVTLCPVLKCENFIDDVQTLNDFDKVVVSGGDGTLNNFLTFCKRIGYQGALGYIPAGSTNDYASTLGISGSLERVLRTTVDGREQAIDIGYFNENPFLYVAAFGIFTRVVYTTPQERKNVMGYAAYILEGAKQLPELQSYRLKLKVNDKEYEGDFLLGVVSNSKSIGGMKNRVGEDIELDDGLFEVMFIKKPENLIDINKIIMALTLEKTDECDHIIRCKAPKVEVWHATTTEWTLDGEYGGAQDKVDITIKNKEFRIIV